MATEIISAGITLTGDQVRYEATAGDNAPIAIDYAPPIGTGHGYNSMELLLLSFASCTCTSLITLLRDRMRVTVNGLTARAEGALAEEHPKKFETIHLYITLHSPDATEDKVQRALETSESKICPIWAMLKGNVEIQTHFDIEQ